MADEAGIRRRWTAKLTAATKAAAYARRVLARHPLKAKPKAKAAVAGWHPSAIRVAYVSAGPFVNGKPKLVWHTTEGSSLPTYSGSAPHFTFDPKTGKLWQHIPITEAAKALEHPAGTPETNRAHAIQVELIAFSDAAFAKRVGHPERAIVNLTAADYQRIAGLARWIEANAGVPRSCGVKFAVPAKRLGGQEFVDYTGHCGHEHVPNNAHWDPAAFRIDEVI